MLDVMTKKVNDATVLNNQFVAEKPKEIEQRVITSVNDTLKSICSKIEMRSDSCESAIR